MLTARGLAERLRLSPQAALGLLNQLVVAGMLKEATGRAAWRAFGRLREDARRLAGAAAERAHADRASRNRRGMNRKRDRRFRIVAIVALQRYQTLSACCAQSRRLRCGC